MGFRQELPADAILGSHGGRPLSSELKRLHRPEPCARMPLSQMRKLYLVSYSQRATKRSHKVASCYLDTVIRVLGDLPADEIDRPLIEAYRQARLEDVAHATVNHETGHLCRMLNWAEDAGWIPANPIKCLRAMPVRRRDLKKKRRAFTDEELQRFVQACRRHDNALVHFKQGWVPQTPFFLFLIDAGTRKTEALSLRWRHWEFDASKEVEGAAMVALHETKNGETRHVPVSPDVAAEVLSLRDLYHARIGRDPHDDELVFRTSRGIPWIESSPSNLLRTFDKMLKDAGIPKKLDGYSLDIHALRMTANTNWANWNIDLGLRQEWLGHADPGTTKRLYQDRAKTKHFAGLKLRLRAEGKSEEEIDEILKAVEAEGMRSSMHFTPDALSDEEWSELLTAVSEEQTSGRNSVGRVSASQAAPHSPQVESEESDSKPADAPPVEAPPSPIEAAPAPAVEPAGIQIIQSEDLAEGEVLLVTPALMGSHLSEVLAALARGDSVLLKKKGGRA